MLNFMTLSLLSFKLPDDYRFIIIIICYLREFSTEGLKKIIIIIIDLYSTIGSYSEALAAGNVYQLYQENRNDFSLDLNVPSELLSVAGGRSRTGIALLATAVLVNGSDSWVVVAERRVRTLSHSMMDSSWLVLTNHILSHWGKTGTRTVAFLPLQTWSAGASAESLQQCLILSW